MQAALVSDIDKRIGKTERKLARLRQLKADAACPKTIGERAAARAVWKTYHADEYGVGAQDLVSKPFTFVMMGVDADGRKQTVDDLVAAIAWIIDNGEKLAGLSA